MKTKRLSGAFFTILFMAAVLVQAVVAQNSGRPNKISHVLLVSIDGMHAVDYLNCTQGVKGVNGGQPYCTNLAKLGATAVNYLDTSTSRPSDSFPGLMAIMTGGTPRTMGVFYDVAYDRVFAPPIKTTGNGLKGGPCTVDRANGTTTEYEEGIDINQKFLNGIDGISTKNGDGGINSIDPARLVRDPFNNCLPVYPWNFVRTNTIYGVIHAAGGYTAWSDKHAVYAVVSGPTGTDQPSNVDDYYSPEVNSLQIVLPGLLTAAPAGGAGFDCGKLVPNGDDWTTDFDAIKCYDQLKVNAILNEINGKTHLGTAKAPVPTIFG